MAEDSFKTSEMSLQEELCEGESGTGKKPVSPVTSNVSLKSDRSLPVGPNFKGESDPQESGTGKRPVSPVTSVVSMKSDRSMTTGPNFKGESDPQESGNGKRPDSPVTSNVSLKSDRSLPVGPNFKGESDPQESGTAKRPVSPNASNVSLKSDRSLPVGPNFKGESDPQESGTGKRPVSPNASNVSLKSDRSLPVGPNFKGESDPQESGNGKRPDSPVTSNVSLKSDRSLPVGPNFKGESDPQESGTAKRPVSPNASNVSLKSDRSLPVGPNFKGESDPQESGTGKRPVSPNASNVSLKSDRSLPVGPNFKGESDPQESIKEESDPVQSVVDTGDLPFSCKSDQSTDLPNKKESEDLQRTSKKTPGSSSLSQKPLKQNQRRNSEQRDQISPLAETDNKPQKHKDFFNVFNDLEDKMIVFIKHELGIYKKLLRKENTDYYRKVKQTKWDLKQTALIMTMSFLNLMNREDVASALQNELIGIIQRPLKEGMKNKYHRVCEGIAKQGESASLNSIYTDLYITEGGAGHVNKEHETRQIEKNQAQQDKQIKCRTMFECFPGQDRPIRTVLTQGVAGVGKSICVQKFIVDWAEGKEHQDIQFIFPLPFRELNLKKGDHSLMDIISFFFPETKGLILTDQNKVMFILDGLDECQLPLSFSKNEILHNVCKQASLDVVLTNLIKGNLLPSALIWITTRPAAASMIPAVCVDRVSEVRGFNDEQKEEYFRKRISDQELANKIIGHVKQSRSLFIMCHIPVFCWISATVLQRILEETESKETPKTLTNMYTCFLIFQTVQGNLKYTGRNDLDIPWDKDAVLALGKLAFQHLEKNSLIFYVEDLKACGIDPSKMSAYSGLCNQETGRFLGTVFSFVHLSIQEFIAAVFAYICVRNEHRNVFEPQSTSQESKTTQLIDFLKTAVDKALESDHGHLDLFLRFLLGLSLESNEVLIRGLLTQTGSNSDCRKEIVEHIKLKFKENTSPERSINLFYCLNELNDDSLVKEIQSHMSSGSLSEAELSPAQWSALVFVLLTSKEKLEEFDLKKFIRSEECLTRLLPVVKEAKSALLSDCNLTERSCSSLLQVLSSESSELTLLDLSNNTIQDSGVELLSVGLKSSNCKLKELRLSDCELTEKSCSVLFNVLNSEFTKITFLHLSNNPIQDCGVEKLSAGLKSPNCKLEKLSLAFCSITGKGYESLYSALESNSSSPLTELDLRGNDPGDSGVKMLTDLLKDSKWKLNKLRLLKESAAEEFCDSLTKTLGTNPLLQRKLDLSGKIHGDSEIKKLSLLLEDSHCRTKNLKLNNNNNNRISEKGWVDLFSALCSNPSHLIELDLSGNKLGDSGMQKLCDLLENEQFKLSNLQLCDCKITEISASLTSALKSNPSHLKELGLSKNKVGNSGVTQLIDLLQSSNCSLEKLNLSFCNISKDGYEALATALKSNTSKLAELDLRGNPGDTGVGLLTDLLQDQNCTLKTLRLLSEAAEKACAFLKKEPNPLMLIELNLSGKIHGDSELNQISDLLKDPHCRTETLRLNSSSITGKGCAVLSSALMSNPSHLKELDLSGNELGNDGVTQISHLLKMSNCKLSQLNLSDCSVKEKGYTALASALKSNRSHVIELDLRGNDPGDTGLKNLIKVPNCKLKLLKTDAAEKACTSLSEALGVKLLLQTELKLNRNSAGLLGDSRVKQLCDLLQDTHCKLRKLHITDDDLTEKSCSALATVLTSSTLRELDLSNNNLQDSGVDFLCSALKNRLCKLQILSLSFCSVTERGYAALAEALKSNSSLHLQLDLRGNDPGDTGVKMVTQCKFNKLRLLKSEAAEQAFRSIKEKMKINPLLERELDLSTKTTKDINVMQLSALLEDPHCRLQKLRMYKAAGWFSGSTEKDCADLISSLIKNPSHLRELDLNENKLHQSALLKLCDLLKNPRCKLEKLKLKNCSVGEEDCAALVLALISNPSHLKELDMNGNKLDQSALLKLCDLLKNPLCKLEKLKLNNCSIGEDGCAALVSAVTLNPSQLKELDLCRNPLGKSVEKLAELLEESGCVLRVDQSFLEKAGNALSHLWPWSNNDKPEKEKKLHQSEKNTDPSGENLPGVNQNEPKLDQSADGDEKGKQSKKPKISDHTSKSQSTKSRGK
ncbi:uncharacterized protein LOC107197484 isoform X2 [Astyanax mexicanus]|uniref:uncharacterized protein LOC107197484 isoform X2 n=1 Tax=Astyanax mexicanus TaxID=7994 RepID=UPI0020CAA2F9|nr:uncharacterized protein LOC107197484 isoform X2 [Astyanax mexicanus]